MIRTVVRSAAALAAAVALAGSAVAPASAHTDRGPASASPRIDVVNLGDSFAAGIGTGGIVQARRGVPDCEQGTGPSHVDLLDDLRRVKLRLDAACSGDTTQDVRERLGLPRVDQALAKAELVTLTLGGNDVGWTQIIGACSALGTPAACQALLAEAPSRIAAAAAGAGRTIRLVDANTDGRIVVFGYPHLFDGGADTPFLSAERIAQLNAATDALNAALRAAAAANGAIFVDVTARFAGHGADSADPWIYFNPANPQDPNNLHPNQAGYRYGYYRALLHAVHSAPALR